MVMTRSFSGMNDDSALSIVVLPVPVPPETRQLSFAFTHAARNASISGVALLMAIMSLTRRGEPPKRRIESTGPSMASGGMMALTREPSGKRASTIGDDSSMRRPTRDTMRSMICCRCALSRKRTCVSSSLPKRSM